MPSSSNPKVLLVNPPVYDVRLDWASWHHPMGLLQYGTLLLNNNKDVRLIDCLHTPNNKRLSRRKLETLDIEGHTLNKWHFGMPFDAFKRQLEALDNEGWIPGTICVTSLNSIWWEGARDTIAVLREHYGKATIVLGGAYPRYHRTHALKNSGADRLPAGPSAKAAPLPPTLRLYDTPPHAAGIMFYGNNGFDSGSKPRRPRAVTKVIKEIKDKVAFGVREIVFFDDEIKIANRDHFGDLLDGIAAAKLDVRFVLPGNISPETITQNLAKKMRKARIEKVFMHCDFEIHCDSFCYTNSVAQYERSVRALHKGGGYTPRDANMAAMFVIGFPYEDLDKVSERLIKLSHIVGSVILVPFQYVPTLRPEALFKRALGANNQLAPEDFNSKLFLLARKSGKPFEEYVELTRLSALLNSKYRSQTFDFLGESVAATMFRDSIRTRGWDPFPDDSQVEKRADDTLISFPEISQEND